jgi:hypothetical protein
MHPRGGFSSSSTPLPNHWARMSSAGGPAPAAAAQPTRLQEFLRSCPLVTFCLLVTSVVVFIAENATDFYAFVGAFAMSPASVFGQVQLYRVISAALRTSRCCTWA